jgi:hypothetical protein
MRSRERSKRIDRAIRKDWRAEWILPRTLRLAAGLIRSLWIREHLLEAEGEIVIGMQSTFSVGCSVAETIPGSDIIAY